MYEINKNKKVVSIMPGLDDANNLKAYPLENTLIVGNVGSGVNVLMQEIVMHGITFNSPLDLSIEWYADSKSIKSEPFLNPDRKLAHFCNQAYNYDYKELFTRLAEIAYYIKYRPVEGFTDNSDLKKHHMIILELTADMFENISPMEATHRRAIVRMLAQLCRVEKLFSLVCYTNNPKVISESFAELFDLRLVTRLTNCKDESEFLMGCDLAANEKQSHGMVWVSNTNDPYKKERLNVKFYPDTFISKYCKVYSNDKYKYLDNYEMFMSIIDRNDLSDYVSIALLKFEKFADAGKYDKFSYYEKLGILALYTITELDN